MNKIIFRPLESSVDLITKHVTLPRLGSEVVPQWFKNIPRFQNGGSSLEATETYHNLTVRHCMPFLDGMLSGYFLTTWTDIFVKRVDGKVEITYGDADIVNQFNYGLIQYQEYFQSHIPQPIGYDPFLYVWSNYWRISTSEGVSCLFTHPLNRPDLPFLTLSGIIDTDKWNGSDVLNFALKEGFEGLIPKGTPYVQIIPFKRQSWDAELIMEPDLDFKETRDEVIKLRHKDLKAGYYRDKLWSTKRF